jgi:hypothetical protein
MGRKQSNAAPRPSPSRPRFPARTCHRKGCGRTFWPRSWNQRYCREPACLRLLHRWQAAKRQRERRRQAEKRQQHAEAERARRQRQREAWRKADGAALSRPLAAATGTAPRAWPRSPKIFPDFCDRPGCYDPLPGPRRGPAQYCGAGCAGAQRRVQDRERKFKARKRKAARRRIRPYRQARRSAGRQPCGGPLRKGHRGPSRRRSARVRSPRQGAAAALSSRDRIELLCLSEEVSQDDPKTSPGRRPRAPPSG